MAQLYYRRCRPVWPLDWSLLPDSDSLLGNELLEEGNLEDIFKKEIKRVPRLFVPIIIISLLEYFFISMGVTSSLEWLPSVSYSTWPYVVAQKNFAV